MTDLSKYKGREQSYIKHRFLMQYLKQAAFKTLQGRSPVFNFVDAFAGPWSVSDKDDYSDASFHQALETLEAVRVSLGRMGKSGLKIRFCFCERKKSSFENLTDYAQDKKRFDIRVFHGSFEDHLESIGAVCSNGFTFTFIDPTGWGIGSQKIFEFLKTLGGEALINFMSNDINRFTDFEKVAAAYGRLLADPSWKDEFSKLPDEWTNEEKILHLFKSKLKSSGSAEFAPDMIIQDRTKDRIKMRLILATISDKGLALFRDVQEKVEKEEMEVRNKTKREPSRQNSLFGDEIIARIQQDAFGVGCATNKEKAEGAITEELQKHSQIRFQRLSNFLLEKYPLRTTHVNQIVVSMENRGMLTFQLPSKKRVPRPDTMISLPA